MRSAGQAVYSGPMPPSAKRLAPLPASMGPLMRAVFLEIAEGKMDLGLMSEVEASVLTIALRSQGYNAQIKKRHFDLSIPSQPDTKSTMSRCAIVFEDGSLFAGKIYPDWQTAMETYLSNIYANIGDLFPTPQASWDETRPDEVYTDPLKTFPLAPSEKNRVQALLGPAVAALQAGLIARSTPLSTKSGPGPRI